MLKKNILQIILLIIIIIYTEDNYDKYLKTYNNNISHQENTEIDNFRNHINKTMLEYNDKSRVIQVTEEEISEPIEEPMEEPIEEFRQVVYNPYNLLERSNITREEMYYILDGKSLQTLSDAYVYMEEIYGINALFLLSLSAEESAWGDSFLAINNNNIGGIKSADGSWAYFSDWMECLQYKAELLYNEYLSEFGAYFNGYSIWDVNTRYCEGNEWADNINNIAFELLAKLN